MKLITHSGGDYPGAIPPESTATRYHLSWNKQSKYRPLLEWDRPNPLFIPKLKSVAGKINARGAQCDIAPRSTPLLRNTKHGRAWSNDVMNSINGGPVKDNRTGVNGLYTNAAARRQFKDLLRSIHEELPPNKYKIGIILCWENFIGGLNGGIEWAAEMAREWRIVLNDDRPIGTGNPYHNQMKIVNQLAGLPVIGYVEAYNFNQWATHRDNWAAYKSGEILDNPYAWCGFWPDKRLNYSEKDLIYKRSYFFEDEIQNAIRELKQIYKMILHKISPSYHFDVLLNSNYWKKNYGFEIPRSYNIRRHMDAVSGYYQDRKIQGFINNPRLLDMPKGRQAFKRASWEYEKELRR